MDFSLKAHGICRNLHCVSSNPRLVSNNGNSVIGKGDNLVLDYSSFAVRGDEQLIDIIVSSVPGNLGVMLLQLSFYRCRTILQVY